MPTLVWLELGIERGSVIAGIVNGLQVRPFLLLGGSCSTRNDHLNFSQVTHSRCAPKLP